MKNKKELSNNADKTLFVYNHRKEICKYLDKWMSPAYYDGRNLLNCNSEYLMSFGMKSNGKSTFYQMTGIICYVKWGAQMVLLRLFDEDFKKGRADGMFGGIPKGFIEDLTKGKYNEIVYRNYKWYLAFYNVDTNEYELDEKPFCYRQCILNAGSSFQMPEVEIIFFDEFIRKDSALSVKNEFVEFQTVISTIKRNKTSLQIFMSGNTINRNSTYFNEMGLYRIGKQEKGTIDTYQYGNLDMSVSVEYCDVPSGRNAKSDKYFMFDNPQLNMIHTGDWQLPMFPHLPVRFKPKDVMLTYFIKSKDLAKDKMLQCDIICSGSNMFTYIHDDYTKTVDYDEDIIYDLVDDGRPNVNKFINIIKYPFQSTIYEFFKTKKIFYKNNAIGVSVMTYLKECHL